MQCAAPRHGDRLLRPGGIPYRYFARLPRAVTPITAGTWHSRDVAAALGLQGYLVILSGRGTVDCSESLILRAASDGVAGVTRMGNSEN